MTRTATIERLLTWALNQLNASGSERSQDELYASRRRAGAGHFDIRPGKR